MDIVAVVAMLGYFGFAAYNGEAGSAFSATWKYALSGAGFLAGAGAIWALWQVKDWREPVAIFTAIIVLALLLNAYGNLGSEIQAMMQALSALKPTTQAIGSPTQGTIQSGTPSMSLGLPGASIPLINQSGTGPSSTILNWMKQGGW